MQLLQTFRSKYREIVVLILIVANMLVWLAVYQRKPGDLKVYFLDIGQGDSILIESPTHGRVLIDGGRNRKVVSLLGKILPFSIRNIDAVIATHPDADHIGGLPEVVERYDVGVFIEPGVTAVGNEINNELHSRVNKEKIPSLLARRGEIINFNDGVKLVILFPNQNVSNWETNDASVVAKLVYKEKSFLFTGDSTIKAENILLNLNKKILNSDVLKAGHHGSRTSTSLNYAEVVSPQYAIISAGKDNTYGHPHKEVLNILNKVGSKIISTAASGTIMFRTDGMNLWVNN